MRPFIFITLLLLASSVEARPASPYQIDVQVNEFLITTWIGQSDWEVECDFQINNEGWQHAKASGKSEAIEIRLPGTSVTIAVVGDFDLATSYEDDVRSVTYTESKKQRPGLILLQQDSIRAYTIR